MPARPAIRRISFIASWAMLWSSAHAHNPDTSYLRCVVTRHALELRFTFDLATLFRITRLDDNHDGRVTREELDRAAPAVFQYLGERVKFEVNGLSVPPDVPGKVVWPPDAGAAVAEKDYHQKLVQFPVQIQSPATIEDFSVSYGVFDELGDNHRAVSDIEQDGKHLEVAFSLFEPDYLYDTGWNGSSTTSVTNLEPAPSKIRFRLFIAELWNAPRLMILIVLVMSVVKSGRGLASSLCFLVLLASGLCEFRLQHGSSPPWHISGLAGITTVLIAGLLFYPVRVLWRLLPGRSKK